MNYGKKLGQYQKTRVATAGKVDLVVMCYEKTIQFLQQAKVSLENKEYEKKARVLQKALDIIAELQASINYEKGGQIAQNLGSIYTFLTSHLLQGDIKKDITTYNDVIQILVELKTSWEAIIPKIEDVEGMTNNGHEKINIAQAAAL